MNAIRASNLHCAFFPPGGGELEPVIVAGEKSQFGSDREPWGKMERFVVCH